MQERCHFFSHLDSDICEHTHTQSVPIKIFHRVFHTKLIMRNRCHYQHRQRATALTALQTALRHRHREMNDRAIFVDDLRNLFYPHMCALCRLISCSPHFLKVAHKLHYHCPSCSRKHVLVGRKR